MIDVEKEEALEETAEPFRYSAEIGHGMANAKWLLEHFKEMDLPCSGVPHCCDGIFNITRGRFSCPLWPSRPYSQTRKQSEA